MKQSTNGVIRKRLFKEEILSVLDPVYCNFCEFHEFNFSVTVLNE